MPADPPLFGFNTPFFEQIEFFRNKLNLPSERWDDIKKAAHDRAFIVAGAMKTDLLADLNSAVDKAIAGGGGQEAFNKSFPALVQKHGWHGWTGEGSKGGEAWRMRVIFETNLLTSRAAGRYRQLTDPELLAVRPYWRYVHSDSVMHPRPHHQHWGNSRLTLRYDHPFWETHFPPNGWGCHCRVVAVRGPQEGDVTEPPQGWDERGVTGNLPGIDKGFDYAPGANVTRAFKDLIDAKLIKLDAPIGAAMWEALQPVLSMERELAWWETLDAWLADDYSRGHTAIVGALDSNVVAWLEANGKPVPLSAEVAIRDNLPKGAKQLRHEAAQNGLTLEEWRALPSLIKNPGAVYFDTRSGKLVFVADGIGPVKAALEFNPKKNKETAMNMIETGFRVSAEDVAGSVKGGEWIQLKWPAAR